MPPRRWRRRILRIIYKPPPNPLLRKEGEEEKTVLKKHIEILKNGGVGVIPTDTIYGIVGSALDPDAVIKISGRKERTPGKGFIVLISSIEDLNTFGVELSDPAKIFLRKFWPGKVSVELYYDNPKFSYLRRPEGCNAFRLPDKSDLIEALKQTGPLIAPSANPQGLPPARSIEEAKKYFGPTIGEGGDKVDFYEDGGTLESAPSTLVRIVGDKIEVLRAGAVKI